MSFSEINERYDNFDINRFFDNIKDENIKRALQAEKLDVNQFLTLLSNKSEKYLEEIASKAHKLTLQYFGRTIQLYTPIYLSNYCDNHCVYCGFNTTNNTERRKLSLEEVKKEAGYIASTGLKHILVLTGESRKESPVSYIRDCIRVLKEYFTSICIETYALTEDEYGELIVEGVDGLTIYQEVYDKKIYNDVHLSGPKKNYVFRLNAPERAARKGIRTINIGVLLGLNDWKKEVFLTGLHAQYLQNKYADTEISISIPRIRPHAGSFQGIHKVTDKDIVKIILALRIFLPRVGIALSTRESSEFRENLVQLGVTKMSAGSTTAVGGHTIVCDNNKSVQFEISDERDIPEIKKVLLTRGYQPVLKDWV